LKAVETVQTVEKLPLESTEPVKKLPVETSCNYTIQVGDSLWRIAKKQFGNGGFFTKIIELNKDTYFDLPTIHPGKKIVIPCS
jgi:nucleoid-associated protein YgaU